MSEPDDGLEGGIRRVLDDDVARLDPAARDRLRQARRQALGQADVTRHGSRLRWWMPAGALAAALIVAVLWYEQRTFVAPPFGPEDFDLLTTREPLDLYRDLDFYQWLAQERSDAG